jgi:hypothetical protein
VRNARFILVLGVAACLWGCAGQSNQNSHQATNLGAGDSLGNQIFNSPTRQIQRQAVSQRRRDELTEASEPALR